MNLRICSKGPRESSAMSLLNKFHNGVDSPSINPRLSGPRLTPCGRTRREFIWQAGGGFVGTALAYLLAQDGFLPAARAAGNRGASLSAPKPSHFPAKAK